MVLSTLSRFVSVQYERIVVMRTLRKTLFWLVGIVVVAAVGVGFLGHHYWSNADRILHENVTDQ